jgi:hypothetical protein
MCNSMGLSPLLDRGLLLDNVPLKLGCVKCNVIEVNPGFKDFGLKNVLRDYVEDLTLGDALSNFIQWPRKEIVFLDEIPQALPRATNVALQPVTLSSPQQLLCASPGERIIHSSTTEASTCDQPA